MSKMLHRPAAGLMTAAALWISGGCGGDSPPSVDTSKTEATVKGVVKVAGAPATEGEVVFNPANSSRKDVAPRSAPIGKDGTYSIKTLTGGNEVRLGGAVAKKNPLLERQSRQVEVKPGESSVDLEFGAAK
jgi:hypothetical protein